VLDIGSVATVGSKLAFEKWIFRIPSIDIANINVYP
jgi:hypothetical protein